MLGMYYFLKFLLFFSIVKALVRFEAIGKHFVFLGILYTALVALISYVFILSTQPDAFRADWVMWINQLTGLSPWLSWLAATLVVSTVYFKLIITFDEGALFWILLILGIPIALF